MIFNCNTQTKKYKMRTKEIIFTGIVNGTIYNSVGDYNKAVQAAIDAGEELNCTSRTYMAPVAENEPEPYDENVDVVDADLTPYFNEGDPNYLDILAGKDENVLTDEVHDAFVDALDYVDASDDLEELHDYQKTIKDIRTKIRKDSDDIQRTIDEFRDQIDLLKKGQNTADILLYNYTNLSNEVEVAIQRNAPKVEIQEKKAPVETGTTQGGILSLLKEILGENK